MTIEEIPLYTVAYVRRIGPYGEGNRETMDRLKRWAGSENLMDRNAIILGIAQDNPDLTRPEDCRYDVCLVIPESFIPNDKSVGIGVINGGRYAVLQIEHTAEALMRGWKQIFRELPEHQQELDASRPVLERYRQELVENHLCEICVPVT